MIAANARRGAPAARRPRPRTLDARESVGPAGRYTAGMEHVEGRVSILAALRCRSRRFQSILIRQGARLEPFGEILELAGTLGVPVRHVERRELDALSHGATHGGIIALCSPRTRTPVEELPELVARHREPALLLLLEGVDDARNLGFALRSADAFGAHAVLIKKHLWDFDPVEIARPASGAYERLPLVQLEDVAPLRTLKRLAGVRVFGCLAGAKRAIYDVDLSGPTLLAIGGEKRGLSAAVRDVCDGFVCIPTRADATTLSTSHAASIVLAEASRQRRGAASRE